MSSVERTRSAANVPLGRVRVFVALALPGCLLVDAPESVRPDAEAGAGNSAGLSGSAGGGAVATGGGANAGGAGARGGTTHAGAGNGGTSGGTAGSSATGGTGGGKGGAGGSAGTGGLGGTGGTVSTGGVGGAGGAGGGSGNGTGGAGASNAGSGGSAGTGQASVCGNGLFESGEDCDDDGTSPGDGCSPTCEQESGWSCTEDSPATCSPTYPSCAGMSGDECQGEDCCESLPVRGGSYTQGHSSEGSFESSISEYRLDKYEVTVARFRAFWNAYNDWAPNHPGAGAGAHPAIGGSGWDTAWELPPTAAELAESLNCNSASQTWAGNFGNDSLPMNCIDWFTAFAFCIWDGGRLPTESEWEFAARWGGYEYLYPWGNEPVLTNAQDSTADYAVYNCLGDGSAPALCDTDDILPVGSKPDGASRYGHLDMIGSVFEWTLDWYAPYPTAPRTNYAKVDSGGAPVARTVRGGDWSEEAAAQTSVYRMQYDPSTSISYTGFRCARGP